jgi:hypothetical protein
MDLVATVNGLLRMGHCSDLLVISKGQSILYAFFLQSYPYRAMLITY